SRSVRHSRRGPLPRGRSRPDGRPTSAATLRRSSASPRLRSPSPSASLSITRAGRTAGGVTDVQWRKDTTLRVGPLRVQVMGNQDGLCTCLVIFDGAHKLIGSTPSCLRGASINSRRRQRATCYSDSMSDQFWPFRLEGDEQDSSSILNDPIPEHPTKDHIPRRIRMAGETRAVKAVTSVEEKQKFSAEAEAAHEEALLHRQEARKEKAEAEQAEILLASKKRAEADELAKNQHHKVYVFDKVVEESSVK